MLHIDDAAAMSVIYNDDADNQYSEWIQTLIWVYLG